MTDPRFPNNEGCTLQSVTLTCSIEELPKFPCRTLKHQLYAAGSDDKNNCAAVLRFAAFPRTSLAVSTSSLGQLPTWTDITTVASSPCSWYIMTAVAAVQNTVLNLQRNSFSPYLPHGLYANQMSLPCADVTESASAASPTLSSPRELAFVAEMREFYANGAFLKTSEAAQVDPANPLPEHPKPQAYRGAWQNLNGIWQVSCMHFKIDATNRRTQGSSSTSASTKTVFAFWQAMLVPFH